jgi:hypothetical protein
MTQGTRPRAPARRASARHAAIGALLVAGHAAAFTALVLGGRCRGSELAVRVAGPPAAPALALDATVPAALAGRVAIDDTTGPGLHRRRWTVRYRGGVERSVGAVQLVGPFQDPAAAHCVGRVVVGQRLLDDGSSGPGTIAAAMQHTLDTELRGETVFPVGELLRFEHLALRWAELDHHPDDRELVGDAPGGYVRASATVAFDRVTVPVVVALVPTPAPGELRFRVAARAELAFDNRAVQWLSDRLGGNRLATRLARRQIDDAITTAFAPPPPFTLPGGQTLRFTYCDEPPRIVEGGHGALPFGVALGRAPDPRILPPQLGHGPRGEPPASTRLALDLDLDALNALLYELWRGGTLDRRLADAGLDRRFNRDPAVTELLSIRLSPLALTLPPVVTAAPRGLRLSAEARLAIHDGSTATDGRLWGGIDFRFAPRAPERQSREVQDDRRERAALEPIAVDLGELELSCERAAAAPSVTLVPCYSDLVAALRGRAGELHGALTASFVQLLSDIFVGRLTASGIAADLEIHSAAPSVAAAAGNATLHLELDAAVAAH